jgi:predicted site-specific integrase-resolvase
MRLSPAVELLTPAEVGAMFRVTPKAVARWAAQGKLTAVSTPGGRSRYLADEVRALLTGTPLTAGQVQALMALLGGAS